MRGRLLMQARARITTDEPLRLLERIAMADPRSRRVAASAACAAFYRRIRARQFSLVAGLVGV